MKQIKEEVCLYYMGFGICAKGLHAEGNGCCAGCSQYKAAGIRNGRKNKVLSVTKAETAEAGNGKRGFFGLKLKNGQKQEE